nr:Transcriptional repressor NrdR [Candidatus Anoxychlamydiales bacterium]
TTKELGSIVMKHLQKIDTVAYIRFACVYERFKDIKEISDAIDSLKNENYCVKEKNNFNSEDADYASKTK